MARTHEPSARRLTTTDHPLVYEINTRVLLREISRREGKKVTLATLPERVLDEWADLGFDAVWLMGVWTTGRTGLALARSYPELVKVYREVLPDFAPDDVIGSPYAVKAYTVSPALGGTAGLALLRRRLAKRGLGMFLDFVCNHTARDHRWVLEHPEYYIRAELGAEGRPPEGSFPAPAEGGSGAIAHGKDPHFPAWTDTAQLNHFSAGMRRALIRELRRIAGQCDGVRCDMAMLALEEVFRGTWGGGPGASVTEAAQGEFWSEAITAVRKEGPGFLFLAEAYWNLEWRLQQLGFDYTYDKTLYDRLLREGAPAVQEHLRAEEAYQRRSLRFIENHDEPRAARTLSSPAWHCAAAAVMSTVPGMALFHEGQLEGRRVRVPVQLGRRPEEPPAELVPEFYSRLLAVLIHPVFRRGSWRLLSPRGAWHDNPTATEFLAFLWQWEGEARLVVVNYAPHAGQCYLQLDPADIQGTTFEFRDLLSRAVYVRERTALETKGMYFDLPPYGLHIFEVKPVRS